MDENVFLLSGRNIGPSAGNTGAFSYTIPAFSVGDYFIKISSGVIYTGSGYQIDVTRPRFSIGPSNSAVDEGANLVVQIQRAGDETSIGEYPTSYLIRGVTSDDVGTNLSGSIVFDSFGKALINIPVTADRQTEGSEVLQFDFGRYTGGVGNFVSQYVSLGILNVVILDTSESPRNTPPLASAGTLSVIEDIAATGTLAGTDAESNPLTFIKVSDPAHGKVVINSASGVFTYTPAKDYNGADSFSFKVNDSKLDSGAATVTLNVAAVNDAPTFAGSLVSVLGTEDVTLAGTVKATDVDTGDALTYLIKTQGAKGAATIDAATGAYTYQPTANANGADSFVVSAKDAAGALADQTINVTLAAVNDLPTGSLSLDGTVSVGRMLTADSTLADVDGLGKLAYQWSANGVAITGASSSQYLLGAADVGKTITVTASYTDKQGTIESFTSNPTTKVMGVNAVPTGSLVITGVATEGQSLSGANTIADADGLGTISTRWQVSSDGLGGWINLSGASGNSLSVKAAQVGLYARAVASYTDGLEMVETVNSAASHKIGALVAGTAQADVLAGTAGDDRLDGAVGADQMTGGLGDDIYVADDQLDLVYESAGQGSDTIISSASYYLWPNVENLTLTGTAYFGVGNALNNVITGSNAGNLLLGGVGNDAITGGDARDAIFGEFGNDSISGGGGIDYLIGGTGNDTIDGGNGADEIYGEDGNDSLSGGSDFQTDILVGGAGNDTLDGGPAWDQMYGGTGDDAFYVSQQVDWVFENANEGYDTVIAESPNGFYLYANIEKLVLVGTAPFGVGNELDNLIIGSAIGNVLLGGAGNDTLDGVAGQDILYGQAGSDTFLIRKGTGMDIIADFTPSTDRLDVRDYGFKTTAELTSRMTQVGPDISVDLGGGDSLILMGVKVTSFGAADLWVV
jgi:VCBS repeat-containing protein